MKSLLCFTGEDEGGGSGGGSASAGACSATFLGNGISNERGEAFDTGTDNSKFDSLRV